MIDLTYIFHSSFLLRAGKLCTLLFDYWKPDGLPLPLGRQAKGQPWFLDMVDPVRPFYVIVSHHHKDHFNPAIFDWRERFPNIHYILSKDTARFARHLLKEIPEDFVSILRPGDKITLSGVVIRAYGSTDIGNSYVVSLLDGNNSAFDVFHAGDLNAWLWLDESTEKEIEDMKRSYDGIISGIAGDFPSLDMAMFPVDSRLGRGFELGAAAFVRKIAVARFFPMHFGIGSDEERMRRIRDAQRFELYAASGGEYISLTCPGDRYMTGDAGLPQSE